MCVGWIDRAKCTIHNYREERWAAATCADRFAEQMPVIGMRPCRFPAMLTGREIECRPCKDKAKEEFKEHERKRKLILENTLAETGGSKGERY